LIIARKGTMYCRGADNIATKMENKNVTGKWSAFKVLVVFG